MKRNELKGLLQGELMKHLKEGGGGRQDPIKREVKNLFPTLNRGKEGQDNREIVWDAGKGNFRNISLWTARSWGSDTIKGGES